jgi:membrane protein
MGRTIYELFRDTASAWIDDKAATRGAALAYYSMFSIAPIVILAVSLAGVVYGQDAASGKMAEQLEGTVGPTVAGPIEALVRSASNPTSSALAATAGLLAALFGAAGFFGELQDALNTMWQVKPQPGRALLRVVRDRAFSFAMVLAAGALLLASLVVTAALNALAQFLTPEALPGGVELWGGVNWLVSLAFVTLLFALIFKIVPDVEVAWRDVGPGALLTGALFTIGKYLLAIYVTRTSLASAYGAAGSLVVVLMWVYYSTQILLFGAEFTRAQARRRGTTVAPARNAVPLGRDAAARAQALRT